MSNEKIAQVTTRAGIIQGAYDNSLFVFKGVPYANPPVGKFRWQPPQPLKPWDGVLPAIEYGMTAPQKGLPITPPDVDTDVGIQDESCLFLNIWTPGLDDARRPVMFLIHGGGFMLGSGTEPVTRGDKLAAYGDIVVVTINYRLGALGFINLNEITGGKIPATGNEGLLDQIAALEWVYENIRAFGGDPDNITVFGYSAGGMSIGILMGMPKARGRFQKAINQSGAYSFDSLDRSVYLSEQFLKLLDLKRDDIDALYALPYQSLIAAQDKLLIGLMETEHGLTPFQPVVDGVIIPESPIEAIKNGSGKNITLLAGTTLDEWKAIAPLEPAIRNLDEDGLVKRLGDTLPPERVPGFIKVYRESRRKRGVATGPFDILAAVLTDFMFRIPTLHLVEAQRDHKQLAYNYLFTYESPQDGGIHGACHGLDIPFLFGTMNDNFCGSGSVVEKLSRNIQDAWVAFARTGDPSCESIGRWPPYGRERLTMLLDRECRVEAAPYEDERCAWNALDLKITRFI